MPSMMLYLLPFLTIVPSVLSQSNINHNYYDSNQKTSKNKSLRERILQQKETRIINGDKVKDDRYPYFALMLGRSMCGAVLIGPRLALGAAHCFGVSTNLRIGARDGVDSGEAINIRGAIVHPSYDGSIFAHDIMMMYLATSTDLPYIQPEQAEINDNMQKFTVLGFGDTDSSYSVQKISDQLLEAELEYVDNKTCDKKHGNNNQVQDNMICAAGNNADSCYGDSGGPLIIKGLNNYTEDRLIGIVSWGRGCADPNFPGVYARVGYFYDWIVETACNNFAVDLPSYMNCGSIYGTIEPTTLPTNASSPSPSWMPSDIPSALPTSVATANNASSMPTSNATTSSNVTTAPPSDSSVVLEFVVWSGTGLGACQGDCDTDLDCIGNLKCMQRTSQTEILDVPGCAPSPDVMDIVDICYDPSEMQNSSNNETKRM
jgi:secreted trypsin-like serine protease